MKIQSEINIKKKLKTYGKDKRCFRGLSNRGSKIRVSSLNESSELV